MINRHIIATGMSRTGTLGMAKLFKSLIGDKNAYHQQGGIVNKEAGIRAYDLDRPPWRFVDYVIDKKRSISPDRPHFDANWQWSMGIFLLEKYIPSLRFFITLRDPIDNASSLKQRRWLRHQKKGTLSYQEFCRLIPDEVYIDAWIKLYEFLIVQIKRMKHRPFVIYFNHYIQGVYNDLFLRIFGLEKNVKRIGQMNKFLEERVNTGGDYDWITVDDERSMKAYEISSQIIKLCKDSWVFREGLR